MSRIVLFVEGDDDQRFIDRVFGALLLTNYELVKIQKVASFAPKEICRLVKAFECSGWEYIFLADKDDSPCITHKRNVVCNKWSAVKLERVLIVEREIESWYISGIDPLVALDIGFTLPRHTEVFSKEHLARQKNKRYPTVTDLKLRMLDSFSIETAKERSKSFAYFYAKVFEQE